MRAQRDLPFLVALADASGRSRGQVQVDRPEPDDFRDAAAGRVQGFEDRAVAPAQPRQRARAIRADARPPRDRAPSASGPRPTGRSAAWPRFPCSRPSKTRKRKKVERLARCRQTLEGARPASDSDVDVAAQGRCIEARERARCLGLAPADKPHEVRPIRRQGVRRDPTFGHQVVQERPDRIAFASGLSGCVRHGTIAVVSVSHLPGKHRLLRRRA